MAIYQRKGSSVWWIDVTVNGQRIRKSSGTENKREAQQFHDQIKHQAWRQEKLGEKPRYTWQQAVIRFVEEAKSEGKPSLENDIHAFCWLDSHLGNKYLDEVTKDLVSVITRERQKPYTKEYVSKNGKVWFRECKPGADTVNRFLTSFRAVLNKAQNEWEWVDRVPKVKALKGTVSRVRWITREEADRLISHLPSHLAAMAEFSLQTGLRRANVTHLEWSQVDLARKTAWIHGGQAKNGKALAVPLNDRAIQILLKQKGEQSRERRLQKWVFAKAGKPIHQTSTKAWRDALNLAGIDNFCWHCLRHTWASWHVQSGTPLHVLQELGGWSSIKMVQRYAHLSGEHLREWVDRPKLMLVVDNTREAKNGTFG